MKKGFKIFLLILLIIIIIGVICFVMYKNNNKDNGNASDSDYVAKIEHNETMGIDAVTGYNYYIYKAKSGKGYTYKKYMSTITIAGPSEWKLIDHGTIKTRNEMRKIEKDIKKDKDRYAKTEIYYTYMNNGVEEPVKNIDKLGIKLFD